MPRRKARIGWLTLVLVVVLPLTVSGAGVDPSPPQIANLDVASMRIDWLPQVDYESLVLSVAGPADFYLRHEFGAGQAPYLNLADSKGNRLPDGAYSYELRVLPRLDREVREKLTAAREVGDDSVARELRKEGKLPERPMVQSGSFWIKDGAFVNGRLIPDGAPSHPEASPLRNSAEQTISEDLSAEGSDLIVDGEACIGNECTAVFGGLPLLIKNGPSSGIFFDAIPDVVGMTTISSHDWLVQINPAGIGDRFYIRDFTAVTIPFAIQGSAPDYSIYVRDNGNLGLRTFTPAQDIHVNSNDTATVRLEVDGVSNPAQTWDVGADDVSFFVKDVSNSSTVPFRIETTAPASSIDVQSNGDVGVGTGSPSAALHVSRSTGALATLARFSNNLGIQVLYDRTDGGANDWQTSNFNSTFEISIPGSSPAQFSLAANGNLTIGGTLTQGSSRDLKTDFASLDPADVLSRVASLPVSLWSYKTDVGVRHVGPMAEDFHGAFGLGADDKHLAPGDQAGVALLAVQGLNQVVREKDEEIADLKSRVEALEKLVRSLAQEEAAPEPER